MAESKAISIRVPDILLEKIDRLAEEKYKSHKGTPNRSLVVLDAIAAYFDTPSDTGIVDKLITVSDSVNIVEFNELRDIVTALSDSVRQLEDRLSTVSDNVNKLEDRPLAVSDGVNKSDVNVESKPVDEDLSIGQPEAITVSDSVDDVPDTKPDSIETETVTEPQVVSLNMEALAKRLKVSEKRLRASAASDESWRELMSAKPDPESLQWSRPVKVGNIWRIVST